MTERQEMRLHWRGPIKQGRGSQVAGRGWHREYAQYGIEPVQKGLRKRSSPRCTLSQNGCGVCNRTPTVYKPCLDTGFVRKTAINTQGINKNRKGNQTQRHQKGKTADGRRVEDSHAYLAVLLFVLSFPGCGASLQVVTRQRGIAQISPPWRAISQQRGARIMAQYRTCFEQCGAAWLALRKACPTRAANYLCMHEMCMVFSRRQHERVYYIAICFISDKLISTLVYDHEIIRFPESFRKKVRNNNLMNTR